MTPNPITAMAIQPLDWKGLPLPNYPAPTEELAGFAQGMVLNQHSLSIIVVAQQGGFFLTAPITISIGYFPSGAAGYGQYCQQRVTQTYAPSTGNTFLCALPEGDGQPRRVHLDITFSQPNPAGGMYNYNVPVDLTLHPRYDVTISPLSFQLITGCSTIGANQIDLNWFAPDQTTKQTVHFAAKDGERFVIREFSWAQKDVSASANLHPVVVWYEETGFHPHFSGAVSGSVPIPAGNLVPGKTYTSSPALVHSLGGTQDCQATLGYTVTYAFHPQYFGVAP